MIREVTDVRPEQDLLLSSISVFAHRTVNTDLWWLDVMAYVRNCFNHDGALIMGRMLVCAFPIPPALLSNYGQK